jgi:hypothetical protein
MRLTNQKLYFQIVTGISLFAIAVFVLIPTVIDLVDQAHFNNDRKQAEIMTEVLQQYMTTSDLQMIDAADVRMVVSKHIDVDEGFVPKASESGFFYVAASQTIVVEKYKDAFDIVRPGISQFDRIKHHLTIQPSELFGQGLFLLTTDGSTIAESIQDVYRLSDENGPLDEAFQRIQDDLLQAGKHTWLSGLLGQDHLSETIDRLLDAFEQFSPRETLYVNQDRHVTTAGTLNDIEKIVFHPEMTTVPPLNLSIKGYVESEMIHLPSSIEAIDEQAFMRFVHLDKIIFHGETPVVVSNKALYQQEDVQWITLTKDVDAIEIVGSRGLVTYESIDDLDFDLSDLQVYLQSLNIEMTSFDVRFNLSDPTQSKIYIYGRQGLIGYVVPVLANYE